MKRVIRSIISRFSYEHLRNESHVEFHETFNALVSKYDADTLGIAAQYAIYKPLTDEELLVLDLIRKSDTTDTIKERDHERDHLFRGFADNVKSYINHYDEAKRAAARKIEVILEHYGNIASKSYDDESAAIEDLHRELLLPAHFPYIKCDNVIM